MTLSLSLSRARALSLSLTLSRSLCRMHTHNVCKPHACMYASYTRTKTHTNTHKHTHTHAHTHTHTHAQTRTHTRTHAQTGLVRTRAHLTTTAQTFVEHVTNVSARQPFVQRFAGLTPPKKAQGRLLLKDRATERDTQRQRERDRQTSAFHKIRIGSDFDEYQ